MEGCGRGSIEDGRGVVIHFHWSKKLWWFGTRRRRVRRLYTTEPADRGWVGRRPLSGTITYYYPRCIRASAAQNSKATGVKCRLVS